MSECMLGFVTFVYTWDAEGNKGVMVYRLVNIENIKNKPLIITKPIGL